MKYLIAAITLILFCKSSNAQSLKIKDLSSAVGDFKGELTYLDYSSGKPFKMLANIKIRLVESKRFYTIGFEYPDEPHANSIDTAHIHGRLFGEDTVVEFKKAAEGGFTLVTEKEGEDGNDHKKAILRHTYLLRNNTLTIVKDVKFDGTDKWIKRNEYLVNRSTK